MDKKTAVLGGSLLLALAAVAMPTDKELAEARGIVAELMSGPASDQKAGRITNVQLAEKAMELAGAAETDAAKLLLVRGAVLSFARDGESARAAAALAKLRADVKDLSPDFEADVLARAVKALPPSDDKTLYGMLDDVRRLVKCRQDVPILEKRLARREDPAMRGQLAECLAALGDWKRALEEFAKVGGEVARVAKFESGTGGKIPSAEVADFWWSYPGVKDSSGYSVFQRHAVEWYGAALKNGSLTGLKRNLAEKRIAEIRSSDVKEQKDDTATVPKRSNLKEPQRSEYAFGENITLKIGSIENLEMIGIRPGSFIKGLSNWDREYFGPPPREILKPCNVSITRPFWIAKYPLTCSCVKALGINSSRFAGIGKRKDMEENGVISLTDKDAESVFAALNKKFKNLPEGYVFRLPSDAEWEYVLKANNGSSIVPMVARKLWKMDEVNDYIASLGLEGKILDRGGDIGVAIPVRFTLPNAWGVHAIATFYGSGLLDMVGSDKIVYKANTGGINAIKDVELPENDPVYKCEGVKAVRLVRAPGAYMESYGLRSHYSAHVVLGPDLLSKAKGGDASTARPAEGPAAPKETVAARVSASGTAGGGERPKDISFKLNARESLEMVGIPSGTFTMGLLNKDLGALVTPRKVEITRPFWFSKYPLTIAGAKALNVLDNEAVRARLNRKSITEDCCCGLRIDETENVLKRLNRRFTNRPKGYVFRFPTAAEYERAFKAEKGDVVDPAGLNAVAPWRTKEVLDYRKSRSFPEKLGPSGDWQYCIPVRLPSPNAWGIGAMGEIHGCFLLDTYDHDTVVLAPWSKYTIFGFKGIDAIGTKDPVFTCRSGDVHHLAVGGTDYNHRAFVYINSGTQGLRIVLGPDLLAEAKAAKK